MLGKFAPSAQQIAFGHAHIDIHRIQLIDGGQKRRLGGDQPTFIKIAAPDPPVYRCGD